MLLFNSTGSDWSIDSYNFMQLDVAQYQPLPDNLLGGGKYIAIPKSLNRKGLINIQTDRQCFILSVVASLYKDTTRLPGLEELDHDALNYKQLEKLRRGWTRPDTWFSYLNKALASGQLILKKDWCHEVTVDMVYEFEEVNKIGVTIFGYDSKQKRFKIYKNPEQEYERTVDLLLLTEEFIGEDGIKSQTGHFVAVPDVGRLFGKHGWKAMTVCR